MVSTRIKTKAARGSQEKPNLNVEAFMRELPELRKLFPGRWVAYFSGCLVAEADSPEAAQEATCALGILPHEVLIRFVNRAAN